TVNVTSVSAMCAKCVMIKKHDMCVPKFVAKPLRKTVASESIKKPRNNVRKLNERFGKIYKWTYIKFTPSGYMWKPKSKQANVNPNVSMPLGSHGTDLYSINLQSTSSPNSICLMAKATSSQAWLWHRRLSHLNFDTINLLSKNDIVVGLPKLKFIKDHLCPSYELGKAKRKSFHTKLTPSSSRRGFLDSGNKTKKKDGGMKVADKKDGGASKVGVSKDATPAAPILGDIAKRVKSIDGVINVPKSILRKAARIVSTDVQEGDKTITIEGSGIKVRFEDVGGSFTSLLRPNEASNKVHFRTLVNEERVESVDCVLPKAAAAKVKGRYENFIVGFFLGKDPSFPVVQQYVSNTWRKFGFERITRNDDGVYLFKFATKSCRDQVIEKGPWMIRKSPIILSKWSPSVSLKRGEVTTVLMEVAGKDGKKKKEKKNKGLLRASKINNIEGKAVGKDGNPLQRAVRGVHVVNDNDKGYSNEKINIGTGFNKNNESVNDTSVSNPVTLTSTNDAPTNTSHAHDVIRPEMVSSSDGNKENGNPNVTSRVSTDKNMLVNGEHVNMENGLVAPVNEFHTTKGMEQILEQGPWLIRNIPLILTKWTSNLTLSKEKEVIMAVLNLEDTLAGHSMVTIQVKYEWRPPICLECHVFRHATEQCPKRVIEKPKPNMDTSEDGFTTVVNRKSQGKKHMEQQKNNKGFKVNNSSNKLDTKLRISDNILMTQELMHNYHRKSGPPRCAFKVDIQKAYDTVHGYFNGMCGLRQGDPLSLYVFTLVMEILTLIIKRRIRRSNVFHYHHHCDELEIVNLCFADDLFLFAKGEVDSARLIMDALEEFQNISGLVPSIPKSMVYFCNVKNSVKNVILNIMPFNEGSLPVKYLGVPLLSTRLQNRDCKILVEKVKNRIDDWKNKSLSFAGCLQLCNSVISSMQVYWASVLVIPLGIVHDIQQNIHCFLWCNGDLKRGKAKVAWDIICLSKKEGGLGIHNLEMRVGDGVNFSKSRILLDLFLEQTWECVADLVLDDGWAWPQEWLLKAPNIGQIQFPRLIEDKPDAWCWCDANGVTSLFLVSKVWEAIRPRDHELLELMLSKRSRKNTKCVNVANEELTAAKHKLMLLVYCC
nr:hypothetical protein [Tanacetum cinerariifolium]